METSFLRFLIVFSMLLSITSYAQNIVEAGAKGGLSIPNLTSGSVMRIRSIKDTAPD